MTNQELYAHFLDAVLEKFVAQMHRVPNGREMGQLRGLIYRIIRDTPKATVLKVYKVGGQMRVDTDAANHSELSFPA